MDIGLSILIPTVSSRKSLLSRLLWGLEEQLNGDVEVIIHEGDEIAMGDKLNRMFQEASGEFVVCVDDDDYLANDYVELILDQILLTNVDYVGYKVLMTIDGKYCRTFQSTYNGDQEWVGSPQGVGPKWPVRREIALRYNFPNQHQGDRIWSAQVRTDVKSGIYLPRVLYFYDYWDKGTLGTEPGSPNTASQRDVGMYPYDRSKFKWINATM